jgi:molecular chaperone GrpE
MEQEEKKIEAGREEENTSPAPESKGEENPSGETLAIEVEETAIPVDVETLTSELNDTRAKAEEYLDGWQRARAEFANYKKRVEREQAQTYQMAAGNILKRYLEISDDLERALKKRPKSNDDSTWAEGIELIYRKILSIMESEGVKTMEAEGQLFDPSMHEAISQEESEDHESGQIIEVVQPGYLLGDRVLRPAKVRVAR